jgi:N-acetylmuramoyl-L-alanine amidase
MPDTIQRSLPLLLVLILVVFAILLQNRPQPPEIMPEGQATTEGDPVSPALSVLAQMPEWSRLEVFQETITRSDFERLLTTIFTTSEAWRGFIGIDDEGARIATGVAAPDDVFHLRFASGGGVAPTPRHWKTTVELPPAPPEKPLDGLHIAIDPGHIGGEWAKIEERWLLIGDGPPVCEGDMTLVVAKLLKPRLEALGAEVSLVRDRAEPVTPLRPDSLMSLAADSADAPDSPAALRRFAERLFYRTAEIRARAAVVNDTLKPDLVLCLHFNADPWGNPNQPILVERSHLHLLLNGAYTDDEVMLADQRFAMLDKLLRRTHEEEAFVGATVADVFAEKSGLPPFTYPAGATNVRPVNNHPYLWARNLLANRLYDCPVIFMEPYVMNSTPDYPRMQAGDYEGLREINGTLRKSIFHEYADALSEGLAKHYTLHRQAAR